MSSTTTTTTTVSAPTRPTISFGNRAHMAIVGAIGAGVLASGIVLANDGAERPAALSAGVQRSQPLSPALLDTYRRRGVELSESTSSGSRGSYSRPDVDQRQAAVRFHHR